MNIAPIEFKDVRYWFHNVNKRYHYLCVFLPGNGEYNEVINEEILDNRYLIDRATGDSICYFFCSSFDVEGEFIDFNTWNIRNQKLTYTVNRMLAENRQRRYSNQASRELQSELFREDVCNYYGIRRSSLPALVLINRSEELYLYPIKSFKDIKILLTPLGIISDFMRDRRGIEGKITEIMQKKHDSDVKKNRYEELVRATNNIISKNEQAQKLINYIIEICADNNIDEATLKKMKNHPEKIRQILSIRSFNDVRLEDSLEKLKDCISQYSIIKKGLLPSFQIEIENFAKEDNKEWEDDIQKERAELNYCKAESIKKLNALGLGVDAEFIIDQSAKGNSEQWIIPMLKAIRENTNEDEVSLEQKTILKCFIAGAKALERERDAIIAGINDQNIANKNTNLAIECYTFHNFDSKLTKDGQQAAYNNFIKDQADVVIFALDEVVGGITKTEFSIAVESLKENEYKKPMIFVFSNVQNEGKSENPEITEIRKHVNEIKQYWIDYSSLEVLKLKLQLEVDKLYMRKSYD